MRAYNAHMMIPFKWTGRNWAKRMGWSREDLDAELREFYDRIFRRYVEHHDKRRWGDKTPSHTWHVDDMAHLFPDAVFVGIVRHPGGSVGSNLTRWLNQTPAVAITHYRRYTRELIRQAARHKERFVIIRYEDLVLHPEPVMRELLEWLGEPWSDMVLQHHAIQGARGGKLQVEGRSRVDDAIDVSRVTKWTRALDPGTRAHLKRKLTALGSFFGYSFDDPAALTPVQDRIGFLIGGEAVDARIDGFEQLDLRTQGTIPLAERLYHPRDIGLHEKDDDRGPAPTPRRLRVAVARRLPVPLRRRIKRTSRRVAKTLR